MITDIGEILIRLAPLVEQKVREEYKLQTEIQTEAAKLTAKLKEVQIVLEESERRRLTDPRVRTWLEKLGSVTYEIIDTLDEFELEKLYLDDDDDHDDDDHDDDDVLGTSSSSTCFQFLCLCFEHFHKRRNIALVIKALNERVDELATEKIKYDMLPISSEFRGDNLVKTEVNTAYAEFVELNSQYSFKQLLIKHLESELVKNDGSIPVISLVGMAGIGKTTVARLVYSDREFWGKGKGEGKCKIKSWISVSNFFDEIRIAKAILRSAAGDDTFQHVSEFQTLLENIESIISGKRIFLVLDDVWIRDDQKWKQIRASLNYAAVPGSVILVTTRNETTARLMGSNEKKEQIKPVEVISEDDCLLILKAFDGRLSDSEDMGRSLAKMCRGLPLAAKTLGNHLLSIRNIRLIRDMPKKEFWEMEEVANPIFASFSFSYYELPLEVRRCFLFCGTIPKNLLGDAADGYITVSDMINVCGILGYLNSNRTELEKSKMRSKEKLEKLKLKGKAYFDKLLDCSLLQIYKHADVGDPLCQMHVLLHDFARYLVKTSRREEENRCSFLTHNLVSDEFVSLKSARVLYVTDKEVTELGEKIGNLVHLRLLNLRETCITELPKTICNLFLLQSLDLSKCNNLCSFPEGFSKLRNLRQLWLKGANSLDKRGIEELTGLQTLGDEYLVRSGVDLRRLKKLNRLEGSLTIKISARLNWREDGEEARKAKLEKKKRLTDLKLVLNKEVSMYVIDCLQAPPNLHSLTLVEYNGTGRFPTWINSSSLSKLTRLEFTECRSCTSLPLLGTLPRLKSIVLASLDSLESIGPDFWGFPVSTENSQVQITPPPTEREPKLESFHISDCQNLRHLFLENYPDIMALPRQLAPSLETLVIQGSPHLSERYRYSPDISHIHLEIDGFHIIRP